ncbi:MAG TPA: hypothetical protein VFA17_04545 [Thermoplasmata archaeon]|jgi:hypothetical protein|nr:hypothetical protein [Thermoplasmata archaeon]
MNRTFAIAFVLASVLGAAAAVAGQQDKVTICHIPADNPDNAHTITVGAPAVDAHMQEGDKMGACPGDAAHTPGDQGSPGSGDKGTPPGNTNPPADQNPTPSATAGTTPWWLWILLVAILGIAAGTAVVMRQRHKGTQ